MTINRSNGWYFTIEGTNKAWEAFLNRQHEKGDYRGDWVEYARFGGGGGFFTQYGVVLAMQEAAFRIAAETGMIIKDRDETTTVVLEDPKGELEPITIRRYLNSDIERAKKKKQLKAEFIAKYGNIRDGFPRAMQPV